MNAIEVRPLAATRKDDYLRFFDKKAFSDNPRWAGCYCYFPYHDPAKTHWPERSGEDNRSAICTCIDAGIAMGYLAYVVAIPPVTVGMFTANRLWTFPVRS